MRLVLGGIVLYLREMLLSFECDLLRLCKALYLVTQGPRFCGRHLLLINSNVNRLFSVDHHRVIFLNRLLLRLAHLVVKFPSHFGFQLNFEEAKDLTNLSLERVKASSHLPRLIVARKDVPYQGIHFLSLGFDLHLRLLLRIYALENLVKL